MSTPAMDPVMDTPSGFNLREDGKNYQDLRHLWDISLYVSLKFSTGDFSVTLLHFITMKVCVNKWLKSLNYSLNQLFQKDWFCCSFIQNCLHCYIVTKIYVHFLHTVILYFYILFIYGHCMCKIVLLIPATSTDQISFDSIFASSL